MNYLNKKEDYAKSCSTFCDLISHDEDARFKSRILVAPSRDNLMEIRGAYGKDIELIKVSNWITSDSFLPMPERIFADLRCKRADVSCENKILFIIGFEGYFRLLDPSKVKQCIELMKMIIDEFSRNAIIFHFSSWRPELESIFSEPRYATGANILFIHSHTFSHDKYHPVLVEKEWIKKLKKSCYSLQEYLAQMENGIIENKREDIAFSFSDKSCIHFSPSILQINTLRKFMGYYCHWNDEQLSEHALLWIYENLDLSDDIANQLRHHFFEEGDEAIFEKVALSKFTLISNSAEKEILLSIFRRDAKPNSYLNLVVKRPIVDSENFVDQYISVDVSLLADSNAIKLANERRLAILLNWSRDQHEVKSNCKAFIEKVRDEPINIVANWLQVGLACEQIELMRRAMYSESHCKEVQPYYRELQAYRSEFHYNNPFLDHYFNDYRKLKCNNHVTEEFVKRAYEAKVPDDIEHRSSALKKYIDKSDVFVIIVDALGAEYLPMLLDLAKQAKMCVVEKCSVWVNLPTSTTFNTIEWELSSTTKKIDDFDLLIHNGVNHNDEVPLPEENFVSELDYISKKVISQIREQLKFHRYVILTADHGSSRLAVLAYQNQLIRTIDTPPRIDIQDWRYGKKVSINDNISSHDLEECSSRKYVVVKGYNRFSRQGGRKHELHGGATLEERLVPFIVFEQGSAKDEDTINEKSNVPDEESQFSENDDFDL